MNLDTLYAQVEGRLSTPSFIEDVLNKLEELDSIDNNQSNCSYANNQSKYIIIKQLDNMFKKLDNYDYYSYFTPQKINYILKLFDDESINKEFEKYLEHKFYLNSNFEYMINQKINSTRLARYQNPCFKCSVCKTRKKSWPKFVNEMMS